MGFLGMGNNPMVGATVAVAVAVAEAIKEGDRLAEPHKYYILDASRSGKGEKHHPYTAPTFYIPHA